MAAKPDSSGSVIKERKFDMKAMAKHVTLELKHEGAYPANVINSFIVSFARDNNMDHGSFTHGLAYFFLLNGFSAAILLNNNPIAYMDSATGEYASIGSNQFFQALAGKLEVSFAGLVLRRVAAINTISAKMVAAFAQLELEGRDLEKAQQYLNIVLGNNGTNITKKRLMSLDESGSVTQDDNIVV